MNQTEKPIRVLYSFPHKLGADRICYTAWQQVNGLAAAGSEIVVFPGVLHRPVPANVRVVPTLARGSFRLPYKLLGTMRALALHDHIVARRLTKMKDEIDLIHAWPSAAKQTLKVARKLGIPTVLERPNAHTRYAYEVVQREAHRLDIVLPADNEYALKEDVLRREETEFELTDFLLCPSDFVVRTFLSHGLPQSKLLRHQYGYDEGVYYPGLARENRNGLTMLFAGDCAVRKGLHFALEAWLASPAHHHGKFLIAGRFLPSYAEKLKPMLSHSSVHVLGFRNDVPTLMRESDLFVLPSIEEGSALVTSDARGSGCVLLVSEAAGAICKHLEDSLVHPVGNVETLTEHITMLCEDRHLLQRLRAKSLATVHEITWKAAGKKLLEAYGTAIEAKRDMRCRALLQ